MDQKFENFVFRHFHLDVLFANSIQGMVESPLQESLKLKLDG